MPFLPTLLVRTATNCLPLRSASTTASPGPNAPAPSSPWDRTASPSAAGRLGAVIAEAGGPDDEDRRVLALAGEPQARRRGGERGDVDDADVLAGRGVKDVDLGVAGGIGGDVRDQAGAVGGDRRRRSGRDAGSMARWVWVSPTSAGGAFFGFGFAYRSSSARATAPADTAPTSTTTTPDASQR